MRAGSFVYILLIVFHSSLLLGKNFMLTFNKQCRTASEIFTGRVVGLYHVKTDSNFFGYNRTYRIVFVTGKIWKGKVYDTMTCLASEVPCGGNNFEPGQTYLVYTNNNQIDLGHGRSGKIQWDRVQSDIQLLNIRYLFRRPARPALSGQIDCFDSDIKKIRKKIRKSKCTQRGLLEYELALCLKKNNDTSYKLVFREALINMRSCYDHPGKQEKLRQLFACAEIYFEFKVYKSADSDYQKAFAEIAEDGDLKPRYLFHAGQVARYLKRYDEAIQYFQAYKSIFVNDKSIDQLIDQCRVEKKGEND